MYSTGDLGSSWVHTTRIDPSSDDCSHLDCRSLNSSSNRFHMLGISLKIFSLGSCWMLIWSFGGGARPVDASSMAIFRGIFASKFFISFSTCGSSCFWIFSSTSSFFGSCLASCFIEESLVDVAASWLSKCPISVDSNRSKLCKYSTFINY